MMAVHDLEIRHNKQLFIINLCSCLLVVALRDPEPCNSTVLITLDKDTVLLVPLTEDHFQVFGSCSETSAHLEAQELIHRERAIRREV